MTGDLGKGALRRWGLDSERHQRSRDGSGGGSDPRFFNFHLMLHHALVVCGRCQNHLGVLRCNVHIMADWPCTRPFDSKVEEEAHVHHRRIG